MSSFKDSNRPNKGSSNRNNPNRNNPNRNSSHRRQKHKRPQIEVPETGSGYLEISDKGFGFLRSAENNYQPKPSDIFVTPDTIKRAAIREGALIEGKLQAPHRGTSPQLKEVISVNGTPFAEYGDIVRFENLTTISPIEKFQLETTPDVVETRIIDLVTPIGKGTRGLIVASPRTGKTTILKQIANAITTNHPDVQAIVLLIDERPEEVTDFRRSTPDSVEVVASTFDEEATRHIQVAEMVMEKARRMVEFGENVVILMDSITRLARGYNNGMPSTGKIGTGGVDSKALIRPKKFFGSARNIEDGGSLTIIGTALVDTGSKADEVIFEEFKGTGNSELHLTRKLVEKRIWPAIDIAASGTRREELLLDPKEHELVGRLRKVVSDMSPVEAMEMLRTRMLKTNSNAEFLMTMNLG